MSPATSALMADSSLLNGQGSPIISTPASKTLLLNPMTGNSGPECGFLCFCYFKTLLVQALRCYAQTFSTCDARASLPCGPCVISVLRSNPCSLRWKADASPLAHSGNLLTALGHSTHALLLASDFPFKSSFPDSSCIASSRKSFGFPSLHPKLWVQLSCWTHRELSAPFTHSFLLLVHSKKTLLGSQ